MEKFKKSRKASGLATDMPILIIIGLIVLGSLIAFQTPLFAKTKTTIEEKSGCSGLGGQCMDACGGVNPPLTGFGETKLGCPAGQECCRKEEPKNSIIMGVKQASETDYIPLLVGSTGKTIRERKQPVALRFWVSEQWDAEYCVLQYSFKGDNDPFHITNDGVKDSIAYQGTCPDSSEPKYLSFSIGTAAGQINENKLPMTVVVLVYAEGPRQGIIPEPVQLNDIGTYPVVKQFTGMIK